MKPCRECGEAKPTTQYHRATQNRDGLMTICKPCNRAKARAWAQANRDRNIERARIWREDNPERNRENGKRYYAKHRDRLLVEALERQRANPERKREVNAAYWASMTPEQRERRAEMSRAWKAANREKVAAANHRRRLARYDDCGIDYIRILHRDPCSYCGAVSDRQTIDHITPVTRDGLNEWENLTAACSFCNTSKHNGGLLEFLLRRVLVEAYPVVA